MKKFWGRNDLLTGPKFSRDDDQLLALNYENLCDGDYLQKLFVNDLFGSKDAINHSLTGDHNKGSASSSESSLLNPEMAEDVILFGDSVELGKLFFSRRLQRELQQSNKFYDSVSLQLSRQVMVFEHIAMLMARRCEEDIEFGVPLTSNITEKDILSKASLGKSFLFTALASTMTMLKGAGDWRLVSSSSLKSLIQILFFFLDSNEKDTVSANRSQCEMFAKIRTVFLNALKCILSPVFLSFQHWNRATFEEEVRVPLLGIFGLIAVARITKEPDDILVAMNFLSLLLMTVEHKSDNFIRKLKDDVQLMVSNPSSVSLKNVPAKVSAKLKQQQQQISGKDPAYPQKERSTASDEATVIAKQSGGALLPDVDDRTETVDTNISDSTSRLQPHGSGTKLWDKSTGTKIALEKEKELTKSKPSKGLKATDTPKMLHELLESKESSIMPSQQPLVINYAITEGPVPSKSNNLNNNDASPARVLRDQKASCDASILAEVKKTEKDLKDSIQSLFVLPKTILSTLKGFNTALSSSGVPAPSSPGKKTSPVKLQEPISSLANSKNASRVYSCGQNCYGELGLGDANPRKSFTQISSLDDKCIVSIGAGNEHSLFVTKSGKLLTAGYNDNGQCGVGNTQQVRQPTVVYALEDEEVQHVYVYNGCEHTIAVTKEGKVYSFGYNYRGQLGLGSTTSENVPRPIRALMSRKVVLAACSYHHTVILCSDGTVFSCGRNDSGQLGHGDTVDKKTPQAVLSAPKNIVSISCGQFHTAACTTQGIVYVCGKNDYGQLGLDGTASLKFFSKISVPSEIDHVAQVCCGYYHTLVLSSNGMVGGFGRNDYGQLGLGHTQSKVFQCTVVNGLRDKIVMMVSAGCYHSVTVTVNGMLYVFGRNNHGQLATGDSEERHTPHPVDDFVGQQVLKVAAGFYHTIVLTTDSKQLKKDSQSYIKPMLLAEDNCESDLPLLDAKQLAENFSKDLCLLAGPEEVDLNAAHNSRNVLNPSLSELGKTMQDSLTQVSGASSSSVRPAKYNMTCRDLLTLFIRNMLCFSKRSKESMFDTVDDRSALNGLTAYCSSLSIMLILAWEYAKGASQGINLPISADDSMNMLYNSILMTQRTLRRHRNTFMKLLGFWKEDGENFSDLVAVLQAEQPLPDLHITDFIASNFSKAFISIDTTTVGDDVSELKKSLIQEFAKIRTILATMYSASVTIPKFRDESDCLTSALSRCLIHTSEICFGDPCSLAVLVSSVSSRITQNSSTDMKEDLVGPRIRLLSALGSTLQQTEDVILLFRKAPVAGIQIYKDFLHIYMFFSSITLDRRLQGHASSKSVDIRRTLTVLELTVANMSKCVFPLTFFSNRSLGSLSGSVEGVNTLISILDHANNLLSRIIATSLNEETLGFLRYGTLIPSLLPSILLYCTTFVKRGVDLTPLSTPLKLLIHNLQLIGKFELNAARSKAVEKKQVTFSPTPTKDKEFHNESFHGSPATEAKDEEINDASAEEILYMKREQHQISWWFRLLRLAVALSGKMVTLDTRKLRDTFSPASAHFGDIWDKMAKGHFDKTVLYSMLTHSAWRHLRWSTEIADKLSNEIWLQEQLTVDVQSTRASGKVIELCQLYRSKEKTLDSVYNMLSKSSQSMFSVNLLNSIEENLFECVSMGQETDLEYKSKLERNFKLVSSVIKYIYSRRSALVTNCGGLSWVEILLVINNVVRVLCYFVRRSVTNLLLYHPLQLPFKSVNQSRSRRLWRKALLVVLCVQRWCNCLLHGYRKLEHDIVDLVLSVVKGVTDDLTVIPKEEVIATRLSVVFDSLKQCSTLTKQAAQGMSNVAELLDSINSITIRSDIVNSVAVSMKDLVDIQEMNQVNLHRSWLSHSMFASDAQSMKALVASSRQIEGAVLRNLKSFLHTTSCTQIELQFAAAGTRLLEILFLLKPLHLLHGDGFTLNLATKLQIFLHDKYATWNNASEERTAAARKGGSVRDRNFALKKCIFSLLSYSQAYAMRLLSPFLSTSRSLHEVLQSNLQLVTYLQSIRYLETQQRFAEEYSMITGTMKAEENKETSSPFSFPTSLLPLLPSNLSFTSKSKDNLSSGKKRFQDIVMKPMEFSRNTEGMVLQGDKLMNSLKGTDFSIATWIYLKGRSNMAKTVLLFGRINHNEAWPLVLLKPDGKLEIAFGTNNEIERIVSEESLPVFSWSHVAIAVEAKKIKLFINGTLDPQVANTKGNSRAYSFPLVIGGCPSSFRTRISNVREGFDGMLAQCKYYSKPLSPIHVRVIFDNGPPETIDISAKVVYHLLATTKALLLTIDMEYADDLIHRIADVSHTIFVTDISKRNRLAALDLLQVILQKDCLHDLTLTGLKYNADDGKLFTKVQLMTSSVCGDYLTFHSRMVCYLLRLAGWCWMPYVSIVDQPANVQGILDDISTYAPLFSSTRRSNIGIVNDSSMEERVGFQFYNEGELSFHAINILHTLLASEKWHSASIQVVQTMLKSFAVAVAEKNTPNALQFMEVLSCALLLGGVSSGGYLGSVVNTTFDDNEGRIVNINVAANNATVLSNKRNSNDLKAVKVRLSDLQFDDNHRSFAVSSLFNAVYCDVWNVIIALSPRISLLGKDFLSKLHPDSTFQQKSLLKYLRPVESLVFYKLLLAVNQINPSSDVHGRLKDLPLQQSLVSFLIPLASGSVELDCHFTEAKEGASNGCSYTALSPVTKLWFGSLKYLESVSDKVISLRFPAESEERVFVEFVSKHLGISLDQEHKEVLNNSGLWGQSLSWLTVNKCMEASMPAFPQPDYLVSEKALVSTSMGSQNNALDMMLTEQESSRALQLLHYIRYFIVKESRKLLQALTWTSGLLNIPSDTMLWINTCPQGVADKEWVIAENIVDVFNKELLWNRVCSRITTESMTEHFTTLLSTMIRYSGLCFLQSSFYTDKDNLLHSMDFFPAFVRNLLCWVEYNDQSSEFECIAVTVLDILLPALPYVESEWLELLLLQICVNTMKKIAVHILNGSRASSVLLELVRNAHFLSLRQIAQEQITKYKNHSFNNISAAAYNYTQLVAHMELIQRRGNTFDSSDVLRVTTGSVKSHTNLLLAKIQSIETLPAKILLIKSTSFEVDLTSCVTTVLSNAQAMEILQLLTGSNGIDPSVAVVEVALGVGPSTTECIFETVYCGTSLKLSQCGLMPDCAYQMKCRAYFGSMPLSWSSIVEFRTEKAVLFTFDSLRCGPDVVLSDDFLTASYTGDDNWSTLLGSRSFSSGVSSWAIRVVQSSTAYIFIGVATSSADLTTFLGGCSNSWGFIGEHALYHNREKVKVYGEAFSTGDIIGVTLDLNQGTLTFCKNGKSLGVAFDKIYGDLYPAVAFYNVGQELQIVTDGFRTSCAHEPIPISPTRLSMDDVGLVNELLLSLYLGKPLSHRLAVLVAEHCNQWCTTIYVRCRAVSQKDIFLATDSPLLKRFGLVVGERVRTYYGVAEVAGSAFNRIWFRVNSKGEVWFFTVQQIQEGRAKKLFTRCTYDAVDNQTTTSTTTQSAAGTASAASASVGTAATGSVPHSGSASGISAATYDAATILDLLDPAKWTEEMDMCLISFYMSQANAANIEAWKMSSDQLFDNFRVLQQGLSRIVMNNSDLLHKWGISGPKRKAVIARLGLFRALNQLLEMYLPFFISDNSSKGFFQSSVIISDDFVPVIETFQDVGRLEYHRFPHQSESSQQEIRNKVSKNTVFESPWPGLTLSWDPITARNVFIQEMWMGPFHSLRRKIFNSLKLKHFFEVIKKSATRALKTDDDYDYPENLPHVKINRLKSFRAREAAELMQVHGEDLLLSSMFCQLYKELRQHGDEKLRISYTHPMDDGQGRSFKIKFEGEGVDDYGGPYREIFQQICIELQLLYPTGNSTSKPDCFLPLLMPAPNWHADGDIGEKYVFMLNPTITSDLKMDLVVFMGQLIGIAIRSRITLDLAFPSFVWKVLVGESLVEKDLASFDKPAFEMIQQLSVLYKQYQEKGQVASEEALEAIRDLTWSATLSHGEIVELVPNGLQRSVLLPSLGDFLTKYVTRRFDENKQALRMLRKGLVSIIPESALSLLNAEDLQHLVCGSKTIDIDRLQSNTEYDDDIAPTDPHIEYFWEVLREFNEVEKSTFLKFVWARPSLPPDGVEFTQKMRVLSTATDETNVKHDQFLPKAHTCFFSINLPKYSTKEIMAEKLRYAIFNCTEMDGDFKTTELEVAGWGATMLHSDVHLQSAAFSMDYI